MKRMIIVSIALILLSACAVTNRNVAGRIENREISHQEFMGAYRGHFENFMFKHGRRPDNEEKRELERLTWRHIAMHVILSNYFEKYDISVTEQEVLDTLSINIPAYIRTSPLFQTKGTFDKDLYLHSLNFGTPVDLTPLKRQFFEYYVPVQKLKQKLIDTELLTKAEQRLIERIINTRADVDWVIFDPRDNGITISDSEIATYYQTNILNFSQEPYFIVEYAIIPVHLTGYDVSQAAQTIADIHEKLAQGEDFGLLARQYSTAPSATNGGDIGFVRVSDFDLATQNHLDATPLGGFTPPLEFNGKWLIYKVADRTNLFVDLHEIVIEPRPSEETIKNVRNTEVRRMVDLTQRFGIKTAAAEFGWDYQLSNPIGMDSLWIKDSALMDYVRDTIGKTTPGQVLEPFYSNVLQSWLVIVLVEYQSHHFKPLDQVRNQITRELISRRRTDMTRQMAGMWLDAYRTDDSVYPSGFKATIISSRDADLNLDILGKPARSLFYRVMSDHYNRVRLEPYQFGSLTIIPIIKRTRLVKPSTVDNQFVRDLFIENLAPDWFDKWMEEKLRRVNTPIR